ncbi:hypothetical protein P8C59_005033 [Phyllachora maydis]|uniref:Uncharacterized protein n=1 Tax=Phyllachora maydis TaxID=1825666 RepID=A0AAD9ME40_9PEZI|nr:hypothetical protein P8C59_005033 [Phyllachora maydis]
MSRKIHGLAQWRKWTRNARLIQLDQCLRASHRRPTHSGKSPPDPSMGSSGGVIRLITFNFIRVSNNVVPQLRLRKSLIRLHINRLQRQTMLSEIQRRELLDRIGQASQAQLVVIAKDGRVQLELLSIDWDSHFGDEVLDMLVTIRMNRVIDELCHSLRGHPDRPRFGDNVSKITPWQSCIVVHWLSSSAENRVVC